MLGLRSLHNAACWRFFKLGRRAGGKTWWRESPTITLSERQENQCRGLRLQPNVGGLTAMSYHAWQTNSKQQFGIQEFPHEKYTHVLAYLPKYEVTSRQPGHARQQPPAVSAVLQCSTNACVSIIMHQDSCQVEEGSWRLNLKVRLH